MSQFGNPNYQENDYDEIHLSDILKVLNKWKGTIIGITVVFMILGGIWTSFMVQPAYEARAVISTAAINPSSEKTDRIVIDKTSENRMWDDLDNIIRLSGMDSAGYIQTLTSNSVLEKTIANLNLEITPSQLKSLIRVETDTNNSDLNVIAVQNSDPQLAAQIANTLINEATLQMKEINIQKIDKLLKTIENQAASSQTDLETASRNLQEFKKQSSADPIRASIEEAKLQSDISRRKDLLNYLDSKILEINVFNSFDNIQEKVVVKQAASEGQKFKPNKKLNVAVAGILGLIIAAFGVFLIEGRNVKKTNI